MPYKIKIQPAGVHFESEENLLDDALLQSIPLEHSCKTGACGVCRAELVFGQARNEKGEIVSHGEILTCQSKAVSDLILKANYYPELVNIQLQTLPCKLSKITYHTEDIISLILRLPPTAKFNYLAGQYIDLSFSGVKRSYSISNAYSDLNQVELHIRKVPKGKMSELLFGAVEENQLMRIEGPKGTFFVRDGNNPLIFMATGTGIAPIKAMVEQLLQFNDRRKIYIYWGMQYQSELYCQDILRYSQVYSHIHFTPVFSREACGQSKTGYVQHAVLSDFDSMSDFDVYACGSLKMIEQSKALFLQNGLKFESFYFDAFTSAK